MASSSKGKHTAHNADAWVAAGRVCNRSPEEYLTSDEVKELCNSPAFLRGPYKDLPKVIISILDKRSGGNPFGTGNLPPRGGRLLGKRRRAHAHATGGGGFTRADFADILDLSLIHI